MQNLLFNFGLFISMSWSSFSQGDCQPVLSNGFSSCGVSVTKLADFKGQPLPGDPLATLSTRLQADELNYGLGPIIGFAQDGTQTYDWKLVRLSSVGVFKMQPIDFHSPKMSGGYLEKFSDGATLLFLGNSNLASIFSVSGNLTATIPWNPYSLPSITFDRSLVWNFGTELSDSTHQGLKIIDSKGHSKIIDQTHRIIEVDDVDSSFAVLAKSKTNSVGHEIIFIDRSGGVIRELSLEDGRSYQMNSSPEFPGKVFLLSWVVGPFGDAASVATKIKIQIVGETGNVANEVPVPYWASLRDIKLQLIRADHSTAIISVDTGTPGSRVFFWNFTAGTIKEVDVCTSNKVLEKTSAGIVLKTCDGGQSLVTYSPAGDIMANYRLSEDVDLGAVNYLEGLFYWKSREVDCKQAHGRCEAVEKVVFLADDLVTRGVVIFDKFSVKNASKWPTMQILKFENSIIAIGPDRHTQVNIQR